jgi:heat shock protein HslJ
MRSLLLFVFLLITTMACNTTENATMSVKPELTGTYWKLIELMGKPYKGPSATGKEMYITLSADSSTVQGHGGCNSFRGKYELKEGELIRFSGLASTMMACPDLDNESTFMKAIESADNYIITGNSLQLNKARMAPLARFEAIKK